MTIWYTNDIIPMCGQRIIYKDQFDNIHIGIFYVVGENWFVADILGNITCWSDVFVWQRSKEFV